MPQKCSLHCQFSFHPPRNKECCRISMLHSENTKWRVGHWRIKRSGYPQGKHCARVKGIDNTVVPESSGAVVRITFGLVFVEDGLFERDLFLLAHLFTTSRQTFLAHRCQYTGGLFTAHY